MSREETMNLWIDAEKLDAALSPFERQVFTRLIQGYERAEIAACLGASEGAVIAAVEGIAAAWR